jgi:hypothetical protein
MDRPSQIHAFEQQRVETSLCSASISARFFASSASSSVQQGKVDLLQYHREEDHGSPGGCRCHQTSD